MDLPLYTMAKIKMLYLLNMSVRKEYYYIREVFGCTLEIKLILLN